MSMKIDDHTSEWWMKSLRERGWTAKCLTYKCNECGESGHGVEWRSSDGELADTWGYMDFDNGLVCDQCAESGTIECDPCPVCGFNA